MLQQYFDLFNLYHRDYERETFPDFPRQRRRLLPIHYEMLNEVFLAIEDSSEGLRLRPDAKFFLQLNFFSMVVRPFLDNLDNLDNPEITPKAIKGVIRDDIETIIKHSVDQPGARDNDGYITGHATLTSVDAVWKQLQSFKWWSSTNPEF